LRTGTKARALCVLAVTILLTGAAPAPPVVPPASDAWLRVNTPNFILFGNVEEGRLKDIARAAERFRASLLTATAGLARSSVLPTYVFAFRSRESFQPYARGNDGKLQTIGGWFVAAPDRNYVALDATRGDAALRIVAHEYVHYALANNLSGAPTWLDEGLAELYSTLAEPAGAQVRMGAPIREHLALLSGAELLPLERLFAVDPDSPEYNEEARQGVFYAQSWLLAHWLIVDDPARRERFNEFVNGLHQGPSAPSLSAVLGMESGQIENALREYSRRPALSYLTFPAAEAPEAESIRVVPVARAEILARLGELLVAGPDAGLDAAEQHFAAALALDASNATARVGLGRLERQREKWDAACKSFEAALAMGGAAARTQYGWTLIDRWIAEHPGGYSVGSEPPQALARARELFREALRLAPEDPLALHGIGRTYRFTSENPGPGLAALGRARELLPARTAITADWIALTAAVGRIDAARIALDVELRRRGAEPGLLRDAESGIAAAEISRAAASAEAGRVEEGRAILQEALERTVDTQVRALIAENLGQFNDFSAKQALISTYNQAGLAARSGDFGKAQRLYEQVAASADDPDLKRSAADMARAAQETTARSRPRSPIWSGSCAKSRG
jgi:tetratricopeptide (TPR) repeat protein